MAREVLFIGTFENEQVVSCKRGRPRSRIVTRTCWIWRPVRARVYTVETRLRSEDREAVESTDTVQDGKHPA